MLAAFAWLAQALSCGYYMFFLSVVLALWMLWFVPGRWTLRALGIAALAFAGAALLMAPILLGYRRILQDTYGFNRAIDEIRLFSADVAGLLLAPEDLLAWGWVHVIQRPESSLFPGLAIVLLAAYAIYGAKPLAVPAGEARAMRLLRVAGAVILIVLLVAAALADRERRMAADARRRSFALDRKRRQAAGAGARGGRGADGLVAAAARGDSRALAPDVLPPVRVRDVDPRARAGADDHGSAHDLARRPTDG